jgi:predicted MPP superfamily phosphohydrolase
LDPVFNLLQLGVDVAAIVAARRSRTIPAAVLALAGGWFVSAVLAGLLQTGAFHLLRLQAWAVFFHAPVMLAGVGWSLRSRSKRVTGACWLTAVALVAVAVDAFLIEPHWLELTRVTVESDKVDRPLRIGVLSDLQTDRIGEYELDTIRLLLDQQPDLILMPGDYVHAGRRHYLMLAQELRDTLRRMNFGAPLGVYAARGNVEHDVWPKIFDGLPAELFDQRSRTVRLDGLTVTGLGLWDSFDPGLRIPAAEGFHIAFGHAPDFALGDVQADLLVAGHTHGGQVRLPFFGPPITFSRVPRSWASGVTELPGGRTLVVSRGIGMEREKAPRLRFLCRPELVVIDVAPTGVRP